MKRTIWTFLLLLVQSTLFAQADSLKPGLSRAKLYLADLGKIVSPNGIQENFQLPIGGINQEIYTRGQDRENPVILFIHGGPASPISPVMWMYQRPLEEYFTMVTYDQRGAGRTFLNIAPDSIANTIHIDNYVNDAIAIAEHIRQRYKKKKVILMGHSWGTIVGMKAALKRPDLFYAYIGIGQVINTRENEHYSFEYALSTAQQNHNDTAVAELNGIAPYPGDQPITREKIIIARKWAQYYGGLSAYRHSSRYFFAGPYISPEYSFEDVAAIDNGNIFTLGRILPEFLEVDLKGVKSFPIPVFMLMGRHDYTTPNAPTETWLKAVKAPVKKGIWFEHSSHMLMFEEPGKLLLSLVNEVRPLAIK
ncbi:alpha/beta hydrolase [Chitinophaga silvisoli]|uniref:Alpha/beta hydrolase n=1 Tax=Chitinophaga silvisoli TaxID=2291814 RepID=A0A3E1NYU0_9BACT|nr:alpha/beta hydrolase [Chitinophaga silvisoli]RFM33089.1 alpha/beta hydrolase [Chitinophaga silvisoli]